jgi:hypothetical protein
MSPRVARDKIGVPLSGSQFIIVPCHGALVKERHKKCLQQIRPGTDQRHVPFRTL